MMYNLPFIAVNHKWSQHTTKYQSILDIIFHETNTTHISLYNPKTRGTPLFNYYKYLLKYYHQSPQTSETLPNMRLNDYFPHTSTEKLLFSGTGCWFTGGCVQSLILSHKFQFKSNIHNYLSKLWKRRVSKTI